MRVEISFTNEKTIRVEPRNNSSPDFLEISNIFSNLSFST
jgi:hypothetical protein